MCPILIELLITLLIAIITLMSQIAKRTHIDTACIKSIHLIKYVKQFTSKLRNKLDIYLKGIFEFLLYLYLEL